MRPLHLLPLHPLHPPLLKWKNKNHVIKTEIEFSLLNVLWYDFWNIAIDCWKQLSPPFPLVLEFLFSVGAPFHFKKETTLNVVYIILPSPAYFTFLTSTQQYNHFPSFSFQKIFCNLSLPLPSFFFSWYLIANKIASQANFRKCEWNRKKEKFTTSVFLRIIKLWIKTLLTLNFPSCHLYMKMFWFLDWSICCWQKSIYHQVLISGEVKQRKVVESHS